MPCGLRYSLREERPAVVTRSGPKPDHFLTCAPAGSNDRISYLTIIELSLWARVLDADRLETRALIPLGEIDPAQESRNDDAELERCENARD